MVFILLIGVFFAYVLPTLSFILGFVLVFRHSRSFLYWSIAIILFVQGILVLCVGFDDIFNAVFGPIRIM